MKLASSAFVAGGMIPKQYTCDGQDMSPSLTWSDVPGGAKSLALIADDPDAPMGTWVHWVAWNIPVTARALEENVPKRDALPNGLKQGTSDFRRVGYGGPCPPPGKPHRYFFKLYALDTVLELKPRESKAHVLQACQGHILAEAQLMGRYGR